MPCLLGHNLRTDHIQEGIAGRIRQSQATVADLTEIPPSDEANATAPFSLNVCIEAGIARGAGVPLYLLASGKPKSPPFMLRDKEVKFYENEADMIGLLGRKACFFPTGGE